MKKISLSIIVGIILVMGIITASTFILNSRQVDFSSSSNELLEEKGVANWTLIATENSEGLFNVCIMIKDLETNDIVVDKCQYIKRKNKTDNEMRTIILGWEDKVLSQLEGRFIEINKEKEIISIIQENVSKQEYTGEYPEYGVDKYYEVGDIFVYDGNEYEVIQTHTSQEDWNPETTQSLYSKISSGEVEEWVQPQGSHDCYSLGDIVIHNGETWENTGSDCNVYEPGVWGWTII